MSRSIKFGLLLTIAQLLLVSNSFSQPKTVTLKGYVTDQQGNPANNATILARNVDTNFSVKTITDQRGQYIFRNMPSGRYEITLVGEGGRGGDVIVVSELPMEGYYNLNFDRWQKGGPPKPILSSVTIVIVDKANRPIEHAQWSTKPGEKSPASLDASGFAYGSFSPGRYEFTISASGYKSKTKRVEVKPEDRIILTFRLVKK